MIQRIYKNIAPLTADHYGGVISSYYKAYGTAYDFLKFYEQTDSSFGRRCLIMLFYSAAVISGEPDEETADFLALYAVQSIECRPCSFFAGYTMHKRIFFKASPVCDISRFPSPEREVLTVREIAEICSVCFEIEDISLWYADLSHRLRHGVSQAYLYDGACAVVDFISGENAYISTVAVIPSERRKGLGAALISHIAAQLSADGLTGYLAALIGTEGYYRRLGLTECGQDALYKKRAL